MKTNQNLIRNMGEFEVTQRTEDGMFNATAVLKQWNDKTGMKKEVADYFKNDSTKEFINTIIEREFENNRKALNINNTVNSPVYDNQLVSAVYQTRRGLMNGGTWMHPLLFIDFAMWINPSFKYDVLKFVYDELIKYRNEAGDAYREMCEAVAAVSPKNEIAANISKVAEAVNHIAIGDHEKMIRNKASEDQMKELVRIEKEVTMLIKKRFIKSFDILMEYLRNEWRSKHQPKLFAQ